MKKRHKRGAGRTNQRSNSDPGDTKPASTAETPSAEAAGAAPRGDDAVVYKTRRTRRLEHPLWIHPEVQARLREHPALFQRLGLIIEQLAVRGRSSVAKTCQGANRSWNRAPLGGTGGRQYYLWWTTAGTDQGRRCKLPAGGIAVRAARHHDDHTELEPRTTNDYLEVAQAADIDTEVAGSPWTESQQRFREATAGVRVLEGRPGSGKTTALWHSVEAREDAHVLYVTWSSALAEDAAAHFESFAAPGHDPIQWTVSLS